MDIEAIEQQDWLFTRRQRRGACTHPANHPPLPAPPPQRPHVPVSDAVIDGASPRPRVTSTARPKLREGRPLFTSASGPNVDKDFLKLTRTSATLLLIAALAGCGTPPARNFAGPWKPVNHFQNKPTEIPLNPAYVFYASPMDETLKTMLARWARDSGRQLSYQLPFDVTLYQPVAAIRTTDIDDAVARLNSIYAAQGVSVAATARRIDVQTPVSGSASATTRNATRAATPSTTTASAK